MQGKSYVSSQLLAGDLICPDESGTERSAKDDNNIHIMEALYASQELQWPLWPLCHGLNVQQGEVLLCRKTIAVIALPWRGDKHDWRVYTGPEAVGTSGSLGMDSQAYMASPVISQGGPFSLQEARQGVRCSERESPSQTAPHPRCGSLQEGGKTSHESQSCCICIIYIRGLHTRVESMRAAVVSRLQAVCRPDRLGPAGAKQCEALCVALCRSAMQPILGSSSCW